MNEKFLKPYDPQTTEEQIYKKWLDSGFFNPDVCIKKSITNKDAEKFSIVLPPPNVTGILHAGHAAMLGLEDVMVRFERMRGKKTLWLPGTDHAAIATQSKVEKLLVKKEKKNRHDLGRKEFLDRVNTYAQNSHDNIVNQVQKLGASVDWSREAFTLDKKRNFAVRTAFKQMYDDGLIYRDYRVINWDPKGQTTISDDEIVHEERKAEVWTFKYSKDFPISIATTRPETKVGDTAVAVNPDDERYQKYIGKEYDVEFCGIPLHIKVIADKEVDPEYGTGALGVTPAHSVIDFEMAKKNDLPIIQVINEYAQMTVDNPDLKGKKTKIARGIIVEWLEKEGLLEKTEEITQNISTAERTGCVIEPLPKLQWFINTNKEISLKHSEIKGVKVGDKITLKELMRTVINNGQTQILPERFHKTYFNWVDNLRPWCISRQIWYGHQIPVWYRTDKNGKEEIYCDVKEPEGEGWEQDPDTLDTWFSAGLWTFSTLGWPENTKDFQTYHPTNVLETGYDIIFFWVARMILMTTYLTGQIPFEYVYIHGLVRDAKGRKISKSLGNNIDPIELIDKYGSDALRMSLIVGVPAGNDNNLSEEKIRAYKKFANKIWNASRFVVMNLEGANLEEKPKFSTRDTEILEEINSLTKEITTDIEEFRLYMAADKLYHYFWHTFADIIIEESKPRLAEENNDTEDKRACQWTLYTGLNKLLRLLHPFMPFVTEEIWGNLPKNENSMIMVEKWPSTK